jgi:hypothetical protein
MGFDYEKEHGAANSAPRWTWEEFKSAVKTFLRKR